MPRSATPKENPRYGYLHFIPQWMERAAVTRAQIIERLGADKSLVSRWLGGMRPGDKYLVPLSELLGAPDAAALFRDPAEYPGPSDAASHSSPLPVQNVSFPPKYEQFPEGSVPVMGQTVTGPNGRFVLNGQEVARVFMPPMLSGVEGAYAVRVFGTSMRPRLKAGMTVWVNPNAIVKAEDDVVVQIRTEDGDGFESYLKEFVSMTSERLRLMQLSPGPGESEDIEFARDRVFAVHKVVFYASI